MAKYKELQKRANELELEFNADIINLGKQKLLFEFLDIQEELSKRNRRQNHLLFALFLLIYFLLGVAVGFKYCSI